MTEGNGVRIAMVHQEPETIELWRPANMAMGNARSVSLWETSVVATAVDVFCTGWLRPVGVAMEIEFVDEDGDLDEIQPPEWQRRWLASVSEDDFGWTMNDDAVASAGPVAVWSDANRVDADALAALCDEAFSLPLVRPGMGVRWRSLAVEWFRTVVGEDAVVDAGYDENEAIRVKAREGRAPDLFVVERDSDAYWLNFPHVERQPRPPVAIAARPEGRHADARIVFRVDLHWSWWRAGTDPERANVDAAVARLVDLGWQLAAPAEAVRLGHVSAEGTVAAPSDRYPREATVAGEFRVDAKVFDCLQGFHAAGTAPDGARVLITTRWVPAGLPAGARDALAYAGPGVAELLRVATMDANAEVAAVVESQPEGRAIHDAQLPLPLHVAADLAVGVARALRAVHAAGGVLREVRPELIYVAGSDGAPTFSGMAPRAVAVLLGPWGPQDQTTSYPFDAMYLAPEVIAGEPADARSDVFSLGAVLAHWLTGDHPFGGVGMIGQLTAIHAGNRQPWRGPTELQALVDAMLAPDPAARPALDEIERSLATSPSPPPTPSPPAPPPPPPSPPPVADPMAAMLQAIQVGSFAAALEELQRSADAASPGGAAVRGILLAFLGRYEDGEREAAPAGGVAPGVVRGEWQRAARFQRADSAQQIVAAANLPFVPLYGEMALALVTRDAPAADRVAAQLRQSVPPIGGRLWDTRGEVVDFGSIADADDAIGQLLECYTDHGLVYFPFAMLRRIEFASRQTVVDLLVPPAVLHMRDGAAYSVRVPRLYAGSSTSSDDLVRAGRVTNFDFVGPGRRAIGLRDFVIDGGRFMGQDGIAAIEFGATS